MKAEIMSHPTRGEAENCFTACIRSSFPPREAGQHFGILYLLTILGRSDWGTEFSSDSVRFLFRSFLKYHKQRNCFTGLTRRTSVQKWDLINIKSV